MNAKPMFCYRCKKTVTPLLSPKGPHIKASCPICKKYIKFVSDEDAYGETDDYPGNSKDKTINPGQFGYSTKSTYKRKIRRP